VSQLEGDFSRRKVQVFSIWEGLSGALLSVMVHVRSCSPKRDYPGPERGPWQI
jgi:hypothetical protein